MKKCFEQSLDHWQCQEFLLLNVSSNWVLLKWKSKSKGPFINDVTQIWTIFDPPLLLCHSRMPKAGKHGKKQNNWCTVLGFVGGFRHAEHWPTKLNTKTLRMWRKNMQMVFSYFPIWIDSKLVCMYSFIRILSNGHSMSHDT